jgi:mercuric ion transport protein
MVRPMRSCRCKAQEPVTSAALQEPARPAARTAGALVLAIFVAFFPKCPMCWAAYCSALGFTGLSQLPGREFLLPLLVGLLMLHLFHLWKRAPRVGFGPFLISALGVVSLLLFRYYAPGFHWGLNGGILLIVAGSAWNSFAMRNLTVVRIPALKEAESPAQ